MTGRPPCYEHMLPHPCVACDPNRAARMAQVIEAIPLREMHRDLGIVGFANGGYGFASFAEESRGPVVRFKRFHDAAQMPTYAKPGDAGADLRAVEPVRLRPFEPQKVRLGVGVELPDGCYAQLLPRSGLNSQGVHVSTGVIDASYRGELAATLTLLNRGYSDYEIHIGDRVAQLVVMPCVAVTFEEVAELSASERGASGFGSTGRK